MANTLKFGNGQWATGNGTALAYNDENANFKPLPFDFTRASSGTTVNQSGLIETVGSGIPRIDFQGNTKGALLLEPSRTNYLLQSNQFDTTWGTSSATVTSGQIGVGGSSNAWLLNSSSEGYLFQYLTNGNTLSIYAKAGSVNNIRLKIFGTSNGEGYFNLSNGTKGASSGLEDSSIESVGNGWYRCNISINFTASLVRIYPSVNSSSSTGTNGYVYIQNAQVEAGSYATSYIPTSGSAVTRVADSCTRNSLQTGILGSNTGTSYFEGVKSTEGVFFNVVLTAQANTTKSFLIDSSGSSIRLRVWNASSGQDATITTSAVSIGKFKYLIKWNSTSLKVFFNGSLVGSGSFTAYPYSNLNLIEGANFSNNKLSDIKLYNTEITDQEAIALTTI